MHDEADRVSVLDLWRSHAVNVPLWARVTLFLKTHKHILKMHTRRKEAHTHIHKQKGMKIDK